MIAKQKQEIAQYDEYIKLAAFGTEANDWQMELAAKEFLGIVQGKLEDNDYFAGSNYAIREYEGEDGLIITTKEGYVFVVTREETRYIGKADEVTKAPEEIEQSEITFDLDPKDKWTKDNCIFI